MPTDIPEKKTKANGLVHVSHRYEAQKPIECVKIHIDDKPETADGNVSDTQRLMIDDELKTFCRNELKAYYVTPDKSDLSVARYEISL